MKKIITITSIAMATLLAALCFTGCKTRKSFDFTNVHTLADLNGATIAAQTGTFHLDALNDQATGVTVKEYPDFTQLLVALTSGAIDGYVAEEPTAFSIIAQNEGLAFVPFQNNSTGFTASDSDTGIAVAFKTGSPLVAQANAALASVSAETRSALMQQAVTMSINPDAALGEALALTYTPAESTS
ncbi:MAG: transporter substrate-binding domain-containing protein, partial [Clostridia bacterium]|nr:transporter substrate-binding domain-containing protein [Clostridia bacterium]